MDNLHEAYLDVYEATAMTKRGHDETSIRNKIAKSTGGGEAADRATALADRPTFGNANKAKQRQNLARAQRRDFRNTTSSNPGLHGYAHQSNDPKVTAKQAARGAQRGVLTPKEREQFNREEFDLFDYLLEYLVAEGYADTNQNAIAIMANMSEEWRAEILDQFLDEEKKEFPIDKVKKQSSKHMRNFLTRPNSHSGQKSKKRSMKMDSIRSTVEVGDDPRNTIHGQDLRKIR